MGDTRPMHDLDDFDALFGGPASPEVRAAQRDASELFNLLETLRKVREDRKISQRTVAHAMGTSQSAVSNLEGGAVDPQIGTLMRYARALDVRVCLRATVDGELSTELTNAGRWADTARRRPHPARVRRGDSSHLLDIERVRRSSSRRVSA